MKNKMLLRKYNKEMWMQMPQYSGAIGGLSLAIGLILNQFAEGIMIDFVSGLLLGIALVANLFSLVMFGRYKRSNDELARQKKTQTSAI